MRQMHLPRARVRESSSQNPISGDQVEQRTFHAPARSSERPVPRGFEVFRWSPQAVGVGKQTGFLVSLFI